MVRRLFGGSCGGCGRPRRSVIDSAQLGVNAGAAAVACREIALGDELLVCRHHDPSGNAEAAGEFARGWYGLAGAQGALIDGLTQRRGDLGRKGRLEPTIDGDRQLAELAVVGLGHHSSVPAIDGLVYSGES